MFRVRVNKITSALSRTRTKTNGYGCFILILTRQYRWYIFGVLYFGKANIDRMSFSWLFFLILEPIKNTYFHFLS